MMHGAAPTSTTLLEYVQGPSLVRPAFIDITPTAGISILGTGNGPDHRPIRWTSWSSATAAGSAVLWVGVGNDQHFYPARLLA